MRKKGYLRKNHGYLSILAAAALGVVLSAGLLAAGWFDGAPGGEATGEAPTRAAPGWTDSAPPPPAPPAGALANLERAWLIDPGEPRPPQVRTATRRPPPPSDPEAQRPGPAEAVAVPLGDGELILDVRRAPVPRAVVGEHR